MKSPYFLLLVIVLGTGSINLHAASYTNTTTNNATWSSGTGWSSTPVSDSNTTLVLGDGTSLAAGVSVLSTNDTALPPFLLNAVTMGYNGPTNGSQPNFIISGNAMRFVADGSTNPTINLNATATSPGGAPQRPQLRFSNAVTFAADTLISGISDALFSGTITNEGGATVTKSNSGTIRFDANSASYSGNFVVSGGLLQVGNNGGAGDIGSGTVTLSGGAFTVRRNGGSLTLNNTIGGTGNVTFQNNGGFTTTVAKSNTYTGNTTISPTTAGVTGAVRLGVDNALSPTTVVTITTNGASVQTLNLNGFDQALAGLVTTGTTAQAIVTNATTNAIKTLTISNTTNTANHAYAGLIAGAVALTKAGAGTQILTGANTYLGTTTVNEGVLQVASLGNADAGTVVNGTSGSTNLVGTVLDLNGVSTAAGETLTLDAGTPSGHRVTLRTVGATTNTWAGSVSLTGTRIVQLTVASTNAQLEISGAITHSSFSGSVSLRGAGTGILSGGVTLSNATTLTVNDGGTWNINTTGNTWGDTSLFRGAMALGADNALPTTTRLTLGGDANSGTLRLNGWSQTIAGLTTSGTGTSNKVVGGSATAGALTVNLSTNSTFDGVLGGAGADENNFALTKTGTGTLTLAGTNTYSGDTLVDSNSGTLNLATNGSLRFVIGGNGTNNGLKGAGVTTIDGQFVFDLANASTNAGHSWTIVAPTLSNSYGTNFLVTGFNGSGGLWTNSTNGVDYVFAQSTGVLAVQSTGAPTPYNAWVAYWQGVDPLFTNTAGSADPDGDNFVNDEEFAFDGNPTVGSAALLTAAKSGTNAVLRYVARNSGVTYTVYATTNLATGGWTNASVTVTNSSDTNNINIPADYTRKEFTVPATGREFFQVEAVFTP